MIKFLVLILLGSPALAAEIKLETVKVETGIAALERGADVLMNDCHSCHSLKYVKYRDLLNLGMNKQKVDGWRGDQPLDAAMTGQMPEDAALQSFGKIPPDLSLMAKARDGGADYVYSYLLGYYVTPEGATGNHIYPETKMPDVLGISSATEAAQRAELQEKARDITSFLVWASDPHEEERIRLGYYVIAYLFALTALLYLVKKQVWSRLK